MLTERSNGGYAPIVATEASPDAVSEGRLRALIQEYQRDEITALTAQFRGMLMWGLGILAGVLIAIVGFFGSRVWTTVDRHTQELAALSTNVATVNVSVGALRDRMDLQFASMQKDIGTLQKDIGTLQRDFGAFQKDFVTKNDLDRVRTDILQAVAGPKRPAR